MEVAVGIEPEHAVGWSAGLLQPGQHAEAGYTVAGEADRPAAAPGHGGDAFGQQGVEDAQAVQPRDGVIDPRLAQRFRRKHFPMMEVRIEHAAQSVTALAHQEGQEQSRIHNHASGSMA